MAAVALSGSSINTTAGTHTVTKTTTVGDLIVIVSLWAPGSPPEPAPTDNNTDGLGTYTLAISGTQSGSGVAVYSTCVYVRDALIGNIASTTFTQTGSSAGGGLAVLRVTGMTHAGSAAISKVGVVEAHAAGTPAVSWNSGGSAGGTNPLVGVVMNQTNPASMTKPATFDSELLDTGFATPTVGIEIVKDDTGNTDSTVTWGSASASKFAALIVELNAVSVTTTTIAATVATATADAGVPDHSFLITATSATAAAATPVPGVTTPTSDLITVATGAAAVAAAGVPTLVITTPNVTIVATVAPATATGKTPDVRFGRFFLTPRDDSGLPLAGAGNVTLVLAAAVDGAGAIAGYAGFYVSSTTYPASDLYPGGEITAVSGTPATLTPRPDYTVPLT